MSVGVLFALGCAVDALVYGFVSYQWVLGRPSGSPRMLEIAAAIQEGASAYLNRQYRTIALVGAVLFGALFRYLPDARVPWRYALPGGFVTAVLFAIGKWLIGIYVVRADVGGAYGAAGSLVVLLVWAYYSAAIFFFGAEMTKAWLVEHGVPVRPAAHAQ